MIEPVGNAAIRFGDREFAATDIEYTKQGFRSIELRKFVLHLENGYIISCWLSPGRTWLVWEGWRQDGYNGEQRLYKALRHWTTYDESMIFQRYDDRMLDTHDDRIVTADEAQALEEMVGELDAD